MSKSNETVEFRFEIQCGLGRSEVAKVEAAILELLQKAGYQVESYVAIPVVGEQADEFIEGQEMRRDGVPLNESPYEEKSGPSYKAWEQGWIYEDQILTKN